MYFLHNTISNELWSIKNAIKENNCTFLHLNNQNKKEEEENLFLT